MEEHEFLLIWFLMQIGQINGGGLGLRGWRQLQARRRRRRMTMANHGDGDIVAAHQQFLNVCLMAFLQLMQVLQNNNERWRGPRIRRFAYIFRTDGWWSIDVPNFNNRQWRENFRMTRPTFNYLCGRLDDYIRRRPNNFGGNLTTRKCVAITLYRLATCCDLRTIANLFGVARSSVCVVVHQVCRAINRELRAEYVVWPRGQRLTETITGFRQKHGFPQCAGAIDGSHIPIIAPNDFAADYYNRKGWHSVVLQAVADHNLRFTDVYVGWPGRVHDARVLRNSTLYQKGMDGELFPRITENISGVQIPVMLLGDPAYPLLKWLMKGFAVTENLSREQSHFNYRLSKARMVVERSFGMLKGRWRILMKRNDSALRNVGNMVVACCILHNFCIDEGEVYNPQWDEIPDEFVQPQAENEPEVEVSANDMRTALVQHFV